MVTTRVIHTSFLYFLALIGKFYIAMQRSGHKQSSHSAPSGSRDRHGTSHVPETK